MTIFTAKKGAFLPYEPACVIRVEGPDAATFLQGQFTNDLQKIVPGGSVYGLWLDRKGRVVGDSHVLADAAPGVFWIASIGSAATAIAGHLGAHLVADDVALEDVTAAWRGVALIGAPWEGRLPAGPGLLFPGRRSRSPNWEWLYPSADAPAVEAALAGAERAGPLDAERLRIAERIPSVPGDIGASDLPNEGGLDGEAISYSKGCYLGQEVMARVRALGRVRRALAWVRGSGPLPTLPAGLWRSGRREGELRSAVPEEAGGGYTGLALVQVGSAQPGTGFSLSESGEESVRVG